METSSGGPAYHRAVWPGAQHAPRYPARVRDSDLEKLAGVAERAADRAREEILPRFRRVGVETKSDGSPVTEADRAAERAIRAVFEQETPDIPVLGEEYGGEASASRHWVVDPIDGTIGFSRGIPLFSTLLALVEDGVPVLGLIDLPGLGERTVGWRRGGVRRNGARVRVSDCGDPKQAFVSHGDVFCYALAGEREAFDRIAREVYLVRGYTDGFGHAQVIAGAIDAMVDLHLNPWDAAATQILVPEAGGRCLTFPVAGGKLGLVFGNAGLVERLAGWIPSAAPALS
jgi:histidinol phosphatase-like enzyme (inositol monophosphatase family)